LFIYKVLEYFVEQLFRQLHEGQEPDNLSPSFYPHRLEWTGHFLIPSLHIVFVTLFLYSYVNDGHQSLHKFKRFAKFVPLKTRIGGGHFGNNTTFLLMQQSSNMTKRGKFRRRKLMSVSTSFCEQDEQNKCCEQESGQNDVDYENESNESEIENENEGLQDDHVCLLDFEHNQNNED
jgi:hypothetical protein